jgi:hypothetical protein
MPSSRATPLYPSSLAAVVLFVISCATANLHAEPIWHCSKNTSTVQAINDDFLAKPNQVGASIIRLEIRDLYDAYQNIPVYLGKQILTACFLAENNSISQDALSGIGADLEEIKAISKENPHLVKVSNEAEMIACIGKHHPAVGYVSGIIDSQWVGPCF